MRRWHLSDDWLTRDGHTVFMAEDYGDKRRIAKFTVELELVERYSSVSSENGLFLTADDSQQLMNELWRVGVRPRDGAGSLAHIDAQKSHLDDMRRLVFEVLPK